jgi:hypothetical protein
MLGRVRALAAAAAIAAMVWVCAPASAVSLEPGKTLVEHFNGSKWVKLTSPSPPGGDALFDVDVLNASDGWAVGVHGKEQRAHPLIERWDGSKWTVVDGPKTSGGSELFGVVDVAVDVAFAVGIQGNGQPLIEQWNGSAWGLVAGPSVQGGALRSVDAVSSTDVWAVGAVNATATLTEHFDGSQWSVVSSPSPKGSRLAGVAAIGAGDVWAVGASGAGAGKPPRTLTEHWDGSNWSVAPSPNSAGNGSLSGVAVRGEDVFAAGTYLNAAGCQRTLILHRVGSSWKQAKTPDPFRCDNELLGIAGSAKSAVAVGDRPQNCPGSKCRNVTLVLRLQSGKWKLQASPSTTKRFSELRGAAVVPGSGESWAVGIATSSFVP